MERKQTVLKMRVQRTNNPQEVTWEVSASGEYGFLSVSATVFNLGVMNYQHVGTGAANGGTARVTPHYRLSFSARVVDSTQLHDVSRAVDVAGVMGANETVAEVENREPKD
jgi:hypothetical protein